MVLANLSKKIIVLNDVKNSDIFKSLWGHLMLNQSIKTPVHQSELCNSAQCQSAPGLRVDTESPGCENEPPILH